ncbi:MULTISPECIES: GAF domain-containing SpoIIE family protein phosphatase [unclassified Streptomyces]|uniref:PP2C family protein-serine/threonine phosphatase n=1 Tax=unclassified Streptomyces TaxID=2593676 RepID=UPI00339E8E9E
MSEDDARASSRPSAGDDWSARLHTLWRAAAQIQDVTALADGVYPALLAHPDVLASVGSRWDARDVQYVRYSSDVTGPTITLSRAELAARDEHVCRASRADAVPHSPKILRHVPLSAEPAARGPESRLLASAGAVHALECVIPFGGADWASLWVGLASPPAEDCVLEERLLQIADVLIASNKRIVEYRIHDRLQVEDAFLAEASLQMDASLDVEETLRRVARLAVPAVAEGCVVHLFGPGDELNPVASAHVAASAQDWLAEVSRADSWLAKVLRAGAEGGASEVLRGTDLLGGPFGTGAAAEGAPVRALSVSPLRARGRSLGTLTFLYHRDDAEIGSPRLLDDLAGRAALAIDTSMLYEQRRRHVQVLQRHLLPRALPDVDGVELSAAYAVADSSLDVGGDFYDAVVAGDQLALLIGDVCGRGAEAAALTGLARHTLRTLLEDRTPPAQALARLNRALLTEQTTRFVTAVVAVLSPAPGGWSAEVASAGHPRPLVRGADGRVREVDCSGVFLGVLEDADYQPTHLHLSEGEALVMFTDGLTEAKGADGSYFEDHLADALRESGAATDPAGRLVTMSADFRRHGDDDTAVLVARLKGRA